MLRRPDRFLLVGGLLIAAQLVFRLWALSGSWFYFDDLAFMSQAMNRPFDLHYLFQSYGGHLMPGGFAAARLLTDVAPFTWWPWALSLLVLQAVAGIAMFRLLLSMFGRRPLVLALLAGFLFYVFSLSAGIWWAAGINQLPMLISLGFGLHAFLEHLRSRRVRPLVAALLWTVAGLLFYEKTLLLVGVYAVVALAYFTQGDTPTRLRQLWSTYRAAVIAFAVLSAGYLGLYVAFGLDFSPTDSSDGSWGLLAWNFVMVTFATATIGGPLTWQSLGVGSLADPGTLVQLAAWAALAGVGYYAFRTRTLSRRAWLPLALTMTANIVLLTTARASVVGPDIAREYRYQTESGALFVLVLGLALLPLLGARESNTERPDAPVVQDRVLYVAPIAALVVVLSVVSGVQYVRTWQDGNPTRGYIDNVRTTLEDADEPPPLVDIGIPAALLWGYRYPENSYSHVFRGFADRLSFPDQSIDHLYVFDDSGKLVPIYIPVTRSMVPTNGCGYRPDSDGTITIPLDGPVVGDGWWIQLSYGSPSAEKARIVAGDAEHDVELPAGIHNVYLSAEGKFTEIEMTITDPDAKRSQELCVTGLTLGLPVAAGGSS